MSPAGPQATPEVCVGDLSFCVPRGSIPNAHQNSSVAHRAPEILSGASTTVESAQMAWAFGIVLWELFSGLPPACMMYTEGFQASLDLVLDAAEGRSRRRSSGCCWGSGANSIKSRCSFLGRVLRTPERDNRIDWVLRCAVLLSCCLVQCIFAACSASEGRKMALCFVGPCVQTTPAMQ
jgi:hypothetical protein